LGRHRRGYISLAINEVIELLPNNGQIIHKPLLYSKSRDKITGVKILRKAKEVQRMLGKYIAFLNEKATKEEQEKHGAFPFKLKEAVQVEGIENGGSKLILLWTQAQIITK